MHYCELNDVKESNKRRGYLGHAMALLAFLVIMTTFISHGWSGEKSMDQILEEAKAAVKNVSVQNVKTMLDQKEKVMLLDIRDRKEYIIDHLHGAENMSRAVGLSPRILEHHLKKIAPEKTTRIIVYCEFDTKAPLAAKAMNDIGYTNAVYMKGGLKAWKDAGYPLEKN